MVWKFIKKYRGSLSVAFVAWLLLAIAIVFETWFPIIGLGIMAYWIGASEMTTATIERREAKQRERDLT